MGVMRLLVLMVGRRMPAAGTHAQGSVTGAGDLFAGLPPASRSWTEIPDLRARQCNQADVVGPAVLSPSSAGLVV